MPRKTGREDPRDGVPPYDVRLVVDRRDDAYRARWIEPEGQESESFDLPLPLDAAATADLSWYLEEYLQFPGAGDHRRAAGIEARIEGWGRRLFDAVFDGREGTLVYSRLLDAARGGRPARLTLGATDPEIHVQPWEMMRDRRGPLVFQGVTIRRQLRGAGQARRPQLAREASR